MRNKTLSTLFVILALTILVYDICAGEHISAWMFACIGLLVAAQLIAILGKQKTK